MNSQNKKTIKVKTTSKRKNRGIKNGDSLTTIVSTYSKLILGRRQ